MGREEMNEVKKSCVDCKTTKTPLWRTGPYGPRSLCNACGIRYRKRKMAEENPSSEIKRLERPTIGFQDGIDYRMNEPFKMRFSDLGQEMNLQKSSSPSSSSSSQMKKQRNSSGKRKLGEVEQAAVLLMSLSCGSVLA